MVGARALFFLSVAFIAAGLLRLFKKCGSKRF